MCYLREICEPLFKPGDLTVELLKAIFRTVHMGIAPSPAVKAIGGDNVATFEEVRLTEVGRLTCEDALCAKAERREPQGASPGLNCICHHNVFISNPWR